jgi:hypothetical protein
MSFENLEKEIERIKNEFYIDNGGKNMFIKKQQKYDCAKEVTSRIPLEVLLDRTCKIYKNSNCVHIDYPMLKSYASPEIFEHISEYIIQTFKKVEDEHGSLDVALNFDGMTVSAAERFKGLIDVFCAKCFHKNTGFSKIITRFLLYNSPSVINLIKPLVWHLMEEKVKETLVVLPKKDSAEYNIIFSSI